MQPSDSVIHTKIKLTTDFVESEVNQAVDRHHDLLIGNRYLASFNG